MRADKHQQNVHSFVKALGMFEGPANNQYANTLLYSCDIEAYIFYSFLHGHLMSK